MSDQATTRLAEIQGRLADLDQANDDDRNRMLALVWHHAPDDLAHLLSLVEQLQGQLDEQRWYGEQLQTSLDSCSGHHLPIEKYEAVPGDH